MKKLTEHFGSQVFNDNVMKERLAKDVYKSLKKVSSDGSPLDLETANAVANAMKNWAVEKGVTHFTHWFQPMTGVTAEKHDSFINPIDDSNIILEFSGKALIQGEPDASSFPNGGIRSTFEARGYTVWDTTSHAFIKDGTLCIPTAFCSYSGESLDKKTPLLRSMEVINTQALRILRLFGDTETTRVITTVGPEQEYFLIDKDVYLKRPDLVTTGRTLFGARPPKGQELEDHYFGALKARVSDFMKDLDQELWALGILSKTKHNEVAPTQHEMAPVFKTTNVSTDNNQITMEILKTVANRHGLACLLHEKPFAGVNGSGKHNNWSLATDKGDNILKPGNTPSQNARFLLFLTAVIKAVDTYQDLLRLSVASAGNDHRLGANEAPPAIISMFLGDELTAIINSIVDGTSYNDVTKQQVVIGATVLPQFAKDTTDRNRTSPFAFTGDKFEFRMPGSAVSIACPNYMINTAVASVLDEFATILENSSDFNSDLQKLIKETITNHKRIIFNGDGYSNEWEVEAEGRGLLNLKNTVTALETFIEPKNVSLLSNYKVMSESELHARYEILLENYSKTINIEALTMIDLTNKDILPAGTAYQSELANLATMKKNLGLEATELPLLNRASDLYKDIYTKLSDLENAVIKARSITDTLELAKYYNEEVLSAMVALRIPVDELETIVAKKYWTLPSYYDILNSVN